MYQIFYVWSQHILLIDLLALTYYIDDGKCNMSLDCGDLLLSLPVAMLYPKQAHLFSFELSGLCWSEG